MPFLGWTIFARARKPQTCQQCRGTIEAGEWYWGFVGEEKREYLRKKKVTGWTRRYHERCISGYLEAVKYRHLSGDRRANGQRGVTAGLSPKERYERRRLVWLRNYHRRAGHTDRAAEINRLIDATGVPAVKRGTAPLSDTVIISVGGQPMEISRKEFEEREAEHRRRLEEPIPVRSEPERDKWGSWARSNRETPASEPKQGHTCGFCGVPEKAKRHDKAHQKKEAEVMAAIEETEAIVKSQGSGPVEGEEE